jgi:AmmeMemoRadiSam system protein A
MPISETTRAALLEFAADIITRRLGGPPRPLHLQENDPALQQPAGCFVSLHRINNHALRGCIGMVEATRPLLSSLKGAAESVIGDPRFLVQPVTLAELDQLEIELSILGPMIRAASPLDFDPKSEGIQLNLAGRTGLFLPQVARETGWTREQLLARLCTEKMGLPEDTWKQPAAELHKFSSEILGPIPVAPPKSITGWRCA